MSSQEHLSDSQLEAWILGRLLPWKARSAQDHLLECPVCLERSSKIEQWVDWLDASLDKPESEVPAPPEPGVQILASETCLRAIEPPKPYPYAAVATIFLFVAVGLTGMRHLQNGTSLPRLAAGFEMDEPATTAYVGPSSNTVIAAIDEDDEENVPQTRAFRPQKKTIHARFANLTAFRLPLRRDVPLLYLVDTPGPKVANSSLPHTTLATTGMELPERPQPKRSPIRRFFGVISAPIRALIS